MSIAIIKYNAGNVYSVECALARLGVEAVITDNVQTIRSADKVIFPGVGEAAAAMSHLRSTGLDNVIKNLTNPVLGICIGQQLLCAHSQEGDTDCLGIFPDKVVKFNNYDCELKIPHTGWNTINVTSAEGPVPERLDNAWVYYVHSYYVPVGQFTTAITDYICPFSAAMHHNNFFSTQFHPEKSGNIGAEILKHFLEL
ncbi:MAG: imidazole glycerol phosphate synthase subunit HisH [Muribaculum sp.]|nr:imidazole glycerol phosphate synthase subunit HisH [Muribaculaceae bacterium]MCM1080648.1 imidazole glycerol phosphate synthase subunit HisH [Muribaculum sp.]